MNNQIICFVDNRNGNSDRGLFHCFSQKSEEFAKPFCEEFLFKTDRNEKEFDSILGREGKNYLFISSRSVKLVSSLDDAPSEWNMLWVHDSVQVSEIKSLFTSDTLVLYHNEPCTAKVALADLKTAGKIKDCKQGMHEPEPEGAPNYYPLLYKIAEIWQDPKVEVNQNVIFKDGEFERIFKEIKETIFPEKIEKLEVVLSFLHCCLEAEPTEDDYKELENIGINAKEYEGCKLKGKRYEDAYIDSLKEIRNTLLGKILQNG